MTPGTKLGPYELVSLLGAGGMGEVWRARDSRLGRDVAVKILPPRRGDAAQFEQEARAIAAINHPNIVGIYDVGSHEGTPYIVVELIEGESLRAILRRDGALPIRKAVDFAVQIADGLAAAHLIGFAHRDLKPENLMVTRDGRIKILDFGLAKQTGPVTEYDVTQTIEGTVKGTPGYLSPEQARGLSADYRSDIFSFGAVLYEMLSGHRAFSGVTLGDTIAEVIKSEPGELPETISPGLRETVRHCLEKDPANRYQSAKDLAFSLRALSVASSPSGTHTVNVQSESAAAPSAPPARSRRLWLYALPAAAFFLGLAIAPAVLPHSDPLSQLRFSPFATASETEMYPRFSPDGKTIAYVQYVNSIAQVFVRTLGEPTPTQLTHLDERALYPFWRQDGNRVFFTSNGALWSVSVAGGQPERVLALSADPTNSSAALTPDGKSLIVARVGKGAYDFLVSSPPGSEPKPLAGLSVPATASFRLWDFSPDGSKIAGVTTQESSLWIIPYPGGEPKRIRLDAYPYSASWFPDSRHIAVTVTSAAGGWRIVLVDTQSSARSTILGGADDTLTCSVAPDGSRIVYSTGISDWDAYAFGLDGRNLGPLAATTRIEMEPSWSPTGDRVAFHSESELWIRSTDSSTPPVRLATQDNPSSVFSGPPRFSPDGGRIAYLYGKDVRIIPAVGGRPAVLSSEASGRQMEGLAWAPDSSALAFTVGPTGRLLKVQTNATMSKNELVATGATGPISWSPDGKTIAYVAADGIRAVPADGGSAELHIPGDFRAGEFDRTGRLFYVLHFQDNRQRISVFDWASARQIRNIDLNVDPALTVISFDLNPDGQRIAITMGELKYDLWLLTGFPQPASGLFHWWRPWAAPIMPQ